jgi:hypothetical protein
LSEIGVAGECFKDIFKSLCGDVIAFDLEGLYFAMISDEPGELFRALISDEFIVEDDS